MLSLLWVGTVSVGAQSQPANTQNGASDFLSLCREISHDDGSAVCGKIAAKFFPKDKAREPTLPVTPAQVGAPSLNIDKKIQYLVFNDANFMSSVAYCYFVFRGWLNPAQVSPDNLGLQSTGFSILNEHIDPYQKWLKTDRGKACAKRVESESQVPVTDLKTSLEGYVALIGLNPLASVATGSPGYEGVMKDMLLTVNHERIHAYQVLCPKFDAWSREQWKSTSAAEKKKIAAKYNAYNWNDLQVAGREFVAFAMEDEPEKVLKLIGSCKIH